MPPYASRAVQYCACCTPSGSQACNAVQKHNYQKARKRRHASVSSSSTDDKVLSVHSLGHALLFCVLCGHKLLCARMNGHILHLSSEFLCSAEAQTPQGQETAAGSSLEQQQRRAERKAWYGAESKAHQDNIIPKTRLLRRAIDSRGKPLVLIETVHALCRSCELRLCVTGCTKTNLWTQCLCN